MELIESGTVQLDELLLNIYFSLILEYDKYIQSLEKEGIYDVAFVCGRFCFFCGSDLDSRKMRDPENGFYRGDCHSNGGYPRVFLADRVPDRSAIGDFVH